MKQKINFRRVTAWIISLTVLMTLMQAFTLSVYAATSAPSELYVGGVSVNTSADATGSGWSYDAETAMLTLNDGANISGKTSGTDTKSCSGIYYYGGDLILNVTGTATVTGVNERAAIYAYSYYKENLTITGDGALYLNGADSSGRATHIRSNVTIDGAEVHTENFLYASYGLFTITDSATVSAEKIFGYSGINIENGSKVYASGSADNNSGGLESSYGDITISGDDTVVYAGYALDENYEPTSTVASMYATSINQETPVVVNGGTLYAAGTTAVFYNELTVNGGRVYVKGTPFKANYGAGELTQTGGFIYFESYCRDTYFEQTGGVLYNSADSKLVTVAGDYTLTDELDGKEVYKLTVNDGATLTLAEGSKLYLTASPSVSGTIVDNGAEIYVDGVLHVHNNAGGTQYSDITDTHHTVTYSCKDCPISKVNQITAEHYSLTGCSCGYTAFTAVVSGAQTKYYAEDNKATGFLGTITNVSEQSRAVSGIVWTVEAYDWDYGWVSADIEQELPQLTLEANASATIGIVLDGLYDEAATAEIGIK